MADQKLTVRVGAVKDSSVESVFESVSRRVDRLKENFGPRSLAKDIGEIALGSGALVGVSFLTKTVANATSVLRDFADRARDGDVSAGELTLEIAKSIPIFGSLVSAGENVADMFGGWSQSAKRAAADTAEAAAASERAYTAHHALTVSRENLAGTLTTAGLENTRREVGRSAPPIPAIASIFQAAYDDILKRQAASQADIAKVAVNSPATRLGAFGSLAVDLEAVRPILQGFFVEGVRRIADATLEANKQTSLGRGLLSGALGLLAPGAGALPYYSPTPPLRGDPGGIWNLYANEAADRDARDAAERAAGGAAAGTAISAIDKELARLGQARTSVTTARAEDSNYSTGLRSVGGRTTDTREQELRDMRKELVRKAEEQNKVSQEQLETAKALLGKFSDLLRAVQNPPDQL